MKKRLFYVLSLVCGLFLSSCGGNSGGGGEPTPDPTPGPTPPPTPGTSYEAEFNAARKNTMSSIAYEYDFNLTAKIKFGSALTYSPANYSGTTYVNTSNEGTQFLQKRELSGLLVFDSTSYIYNIDNDLIKISADENKDFSVINHESVSLPYDFDRFNFGHILKELNDDGLIKATKSGDKYNLSLKTNFSQDSLLGMLNFIDSSLILKTLNSYAKAEWGVYFTVNTWATLSNNQIKKFHFDATVNMSGKFSIGFEFEQTFNKYSGVTITLPTFANTYTSESDVKNQITTVKNALLNAKSASTSYYDYKTKTTVDHGISLSNPLGLAVNSTTKGVAKRELKNNKVYFNNKLEVDSDYKNNDQYGDLVKDYRSYRARLSNETDDVYNVYDPLVGFNKYTLMEDYHNDAIDNYYMLPSESLLDFNNLKVAKVTTDSDSNKTYKFGLTTDAVKSILKFYNSHVRIDFDEVTLFDIYDIKNSFAGNKASLCYVIGSDGKLSSIDIDLKGFYVDNKTDKQIKFRLEVEMDYNWSKTYTAVSNKEDIDN